MERGGDNLTIWIEIVRIETEKKGVKEIRIISVNEEYQPLRDMLLHFIQVLKSD